MTSDRWEHINRIYNAAVEVEEKERASFLENACDGDEELRREVESLLAYDQQAQQFIDRPAMQMAAEKLASEPASLLGKKLGPYQVQVLLGSGGMGDVYRARDTRLNRIVAIKVLPRHLLARSDLRQRFEREARAIASLDHPHICALYDIGREDTTDFLVMQYLDGETLSQRLRKGPLPTAEVVRYAIEIAGALEQAHRKGVVHRDLKPGNIMLTETGAKLLDFGLAKRQPVSLMAPPSALSPLARGTTGGPTETKSLTDEGMILGTLEYMAPEQLEGKETDARTDIFALGVVMYEMATGQKAFQGDSKASLIAKILTVQPPPIETIQPVSPPELDTVVRRCLAKKPEERWQSAAEMNSELREITDTVLPLQRTRKGEKKSSSRPKETEPKSELSATMAVAKPLKRLPQLIRSRAGKIGLAGVLLAVIAASLVLWRVRPQPEKPKEISFKPLTTYPWDNRVESAAISPGGKYLAFCLKGKLFVQIRASGEKLPISVPEWFYSTRVAWFPDEAKLLLHRAEQTWVQVKGETKRLPDASLWSMSILGGAPQKLADHAGHASVSPDGSLVAFDRFDPEQQVRDIWLVGANGYGKGPRMLRQSSRPKQSYRTPVWSSNGERLYYLRTFENDSSIESCDIQGEHVTTTFSSKAPVGYLCGATDGRIFLTMREPGPQNNWNLWEIKADVATGRLVNQARRLTDFSGYNWVAARDLSITADAKQLVMVRGSAHSDTYVAEAEAGGKSMKNPRRLTWNETEDWVWDWTADSQRVLFESNRNGNFDIFKQDMNETDAEPIVATSEDEKHPNLSPDRAFILYEVSEKRGAPANRLMRIPAAGGPAELVLSGEKIKGFSCAREVNLCVVVEEVEGKQVLTTFDPLKGRGEKVPLTDYSHPATGFLSPQGRLIEKMKSGPNGLYVSVRSLTGGPAEEIAFKNLTGDYLFCGWSLDGKGIYIMEWPPPGDYAALFAGLDGRSQVLWKRGTSQGWTFHRCVPSPNGRYLAFSIVSSESNVWMLENF